jgi:HAE1 family hydrophobic/amphiphilic exporter-1
MPWKWRNQVSNVFTDFEQNMPPGMYVEKIYDTTDFINASIKEV